MSQRADFIWPQGEDLNLNLNYKEGATAGSAKVLDLRTGYELRMDLFVPSNSTVVYTVPTSGTSSVTLEGSKPNIRIFLPRALLLPGGVLYPNLATVTKFGYDIFLRNTVTDRQVKVLRGSLKVEKSGTLWA